ncbi:MAG: DNA mismatch repair protein [Enterovibrio sp.]
MENTLLITEEKDRRNVHISSIFYGRVSIFHPSQRLTPSMMSRLAEVAASGGTDLNNPLESVDFQYKGRVHKIGLHVDYLLHPHRDILEMIIAYSRTVKLLEEEQEKGIPLTWLSVLSSVKGIQITNPQKESRAIISSDATVFSISMYELAKRLKIKPHRSNYDLIERRITQLSTAMISVSELDEAGNIVDINPFSFIDSFRFCCNASKNKNKKSNGSSTNHIFIVLSNQLVEAIMEHPAKHYREDQYKITHYNSLPLRSCIKWLTTHEPEFLHTKKLDWVLKQYIASIATPTSSSFKSKLKKELLSNAEQILKDYKLEIRIKSGTKNQYQFFSASQ